MTTIYPTNRCSSFNEWTAYIRKSVVNAQLTQEAQLDIEATAFVKSLKHQTIFH